MPFITASSTRSSAPSIANHGRRSVSRSVWRAELSADDVLTSDVLTNLVCPLSEARAWSPASRMQGLMHVGLDAFLDE